MAEHLRELLAFSIVIVATAVAFRSYSRLQRSNLSPTAGARGRVFLFLGLLGLVIVASLIVLLQLSPQLTSQAFPRAVSKPTFDSVLAAQSRDSSTIVNAHNSLAAARRRQESTDTMLEGVNLAARTRLSQAIHKYEAAIRIDSLNAKAYGLKGYALLRLGRVEEAIQVMQKGIEIDSTSPWEHYNLALAQWKKGDIPNALDSVRHTLELDCGFKDVILKDVQYQAFLRSDPSLRNLIQGPCPSVNSTG